MEKNPPLTKMVRVNDFGSLLEHLENLLVDGKAEAFSVAFNDINENAKILFSQFRVDGNVKKVIETHSFLENLKCIKSKALASGIVL